MLERILSYEERAKKSFNLVARKLFLLMAKKETNLVFANDETNAKRFLKITDALGSEIAVLKTHIDIIEDFSNELIGELLNLSKKHDFLIFEDRKFIDIGNTVKLQCAGNYKIMNWADLVSISPLSGIGVIDGISEAMKMVNKEMGIMILAQMSTNGNLADENYTRKAIEIGNKRKEFIAGYIGSNLPDRLKELNPIFNTGYVIMVPGIKIFEGKDNLGQRYFSPEEIIKNGADCIIVGRGIYESNNPIKTARRYRDLGWKTYLEKIKN